ncbi:LLM class flavin-dependent oxidoreductase, partial [Paenibacillus sepulcri]|nr:LLM class flavin-dependent oxidoreductase [Paenibacillus sepulcri]
ECVFLGAPTLAALKQHIADIRAQAQAYGRQPGHIKMFTGLSVIVGRTEEEVNRKVEEFGRLRSVEGVLAHYGGSSGYDLSRYGPDDYLEYVET